MSRGAIAALAIVGSMIALTLVLIVAGMAHDGHLHRVGTIFCASRGMSFQMGSRTPSVCVAPDGRVYDLTTLRGSRI